MLLGYETNISKKVVVDIYAGIGKMNRTSKEYNREYNYKIDTSLSPIDVNVTFSNATGYLSEYNG
ncbi:MAG: hypothetical protein ABJA79_06320, partial [Parafilimonas sp.]